MSGAIGFFSLVIFAVIMVFTGVDYSSKVIVDNNIHDATRTTQLTTLQDSIEIGNLIVNDQVTISEEDVLDLWLDNFKKNDDTKLTYDIEIVSVHENPAGIKVSVKAYEDYQMLDTQLVQEYESIIIVDDGKE